MLLSFRAQASFAFGLLVLALSAALSFGLASHYTRIALDDQGETVQTLARSTATVLADGLYERMREVELLTYTPPSGLKTRDEIRRWQPVIDHMQATRPQFSWIAVTDPQGRVLAATGDMLVGQNVAARPWFQMGKSQPYAGDVHKAKLLAPLLPRSTSGEPLRFIDFAAPIRDASGNLQGVLGVHATWEWAREVIATLRSDRVKEKGVRVFILSHEGEIIHRPLGVSASARPLVMPEKSTATAALIRWSDGAEYLTATAAVANRHKATHLGWEVVVRQPVEIATAAAKHARNVFLTLAFAAAALAMVAAWWMLGRVSRPLRTLSEAARHVSSVGPSAEIPALRATREIFHLSTALRAMKSALARREVDLEEANNRLEERVVERTSQLATAHLQLEQANAKLAVQALQDPLTALYNRRAADERMAFEIARHQRTDKPLSLLLLDIDFFKKINDTLGHPGGDQVLKTVASTLTAACRLTDFVARFGGEEFLILLPETPRAGALIAAEKIRKTIEDCAAMPVPVTVSIGLATHVERFARAEDAIHAADEALYAAKHAGRNCVRSAPVCGVEACGAAV